MSVYIGSVIVKIYCGHEVGSASPLARRLQPCSLALKEAQSVVVLVARRVGEAASAAILAEKEWKPV